MTLEITIDKCIWKERLEKDKFRGLNGEPRTDNCETCSGYVSRFQCLYFIDRGHLTDFRRYELK